MNLLNIRTDQCELDLLSLGSLVHRLDPGIVPFRKARGVDIHVSGGEYNVARGLRKCFGLKTAVVNHCTQDCGATAFLIPDIRAFSFAAVPIRFSTSRIRRAYRPRVAGPSLM